MRVLRFFGVVFLIVGLAVLAADVEMSISRGEAFMLSALGEWWFAIHPESLQVLQPAVQRHVSPALWDSVIQPLLEWPLALEALAIGVVLLLLGRPWHRRG